MDITGSFLQNKDPKLAAVSKYNDNNNKLNRVFKCNLKASNEN